MSHIDYSEHLDQSETSDHSEYSQQDEYYDQSDVYADPYADPYSENYTDGSTEPSMRLVDAGSSFVAEFIDGYSFRNLVEYLRGTNTQGSFRFSRDGITYQEADSGNTIINQIEIQASELYQYEYNSVEDEIIVGVAIQDIRAVTKTIGKKDSLTIYKMAEDDMLYFRTVGNLERSSERVNMCLVRPKQIEVKNYEMPEYKPRPNCTVQASVFSKVCAAMASIKCRWIVISGAKQGITLKAMMENGVLGRVENLGDVSDVNGTDDRFSRMRTIEPDPNAPKVRINVVGGTEYPSIKVKTTNIKALSKLNNLCSHGMVKIFIEPNNPLLRLSCKVGGYGVLNVYIRSPESE